MFLDVGFTYDMVYSYGDGLEKLLSRDVEGRCPYIQTWLFSSPGYGELPDLASDKDTNKIVPFLKALTDFWKLGGGLFCFCDNYPFVFETNKLLKMLEFRKDNKSYSKTKVQFGGNYDGKGWIRVGKSNNAEYGTFSPDVRLGKTNERLSLRPGLIKFYEGATISSAVDDNSEPLNTKAELWPFVPFAWSTEKSKTLDHLFFTMTNS
jgi:hypothetical protein